MSLRTKRVKFDPLFGELKEILDIMYHRKNIKVSSMRIYQICYDICSARNQTHVDNLFCSLADYFINLTLQLREKLLANEPEILTHYAKEFESYEKNSRHLNDHCVYFNDTLFPPTEDLAPEFYSTSFGEDVKITHPRYRRQKVLSLCYSIWTDLIIYAIAGSDSNSILNQLLTTINRDRQGHMVDLKALRIVIHSFVETDSQARPGKAGLSLALYQKEFETFFIEETHRYYNAEAALAIAELTIPRYLAKAEARIKHEIRRNELVLHPTTLPKALLTIQSEFLVSHCDKIYPSLVKLIESESFEDCHRLYSLMSSFQDGTKPLLTIFEEFVLAKGRDALALFDKLPSKDPREYVDLLLEVHHKYSRLCTEVFDNDPLFVTSLDKAFRRIINSTRETAKESSPSAPELLAKYADILLKKSHRSPDSAPLGLTASHASLLTKLSSQFSDGDIESQLGDLVILFKYIDDKDVFQKFYSRLLAKRLIYDTSISEEAEANMIGKLKGACGLEYTSKIQRMITDAALNTDLNTLFRDHIRQSGPKLSGEHAFLILTAGAWPLHIPNKSDLIIPKELDEGLGTFTKFYDTQHNGRKISWLWHLFRGEIRVNFLEKRYEIAGTLAHAAILLKYNDATCYTLRELMSVLQMTEGEAIQGLKSLLDCRILLLDGQKPQLGPDRKPIHRVLPDSRLVLNAKFVSKRTKIKLPGPTVAEAVQDAQATKKEIESDRSMYLQASIVRIMKMRQHLPHQPLVAEVIKGCQGHFTPTVPAIKKAIDHLLDKQYLERAPNAPDTYHYLA